MDSASARAASAAACASPPADSARARCASTSARAACASARADCASACAACASAAAACASARAACASPRAETTSAWAASAAARAALTSAAAAAAATRVCSDAARGVKLAAGLLEARSRLVALAGQQLGAAVAGRLHGERACACRVALGLGVGELAERLLALDLRRGRVVLGLLEALAQHARALDEFLEAGELVDGLRVGAVGGAAGGLVPAAGGLGGGDARGLALLGHAALDVLPRQRGRVDVAHDDEDARQARARIGLMAVAHDALDRLQRAAMAQAQILGIPCPGVARAQLAEQRGELPAEGERHRHDDEAQRANRPAGRVRAERARRRGVGAVGEQELVERRASGLVGTGHEHLGGRPSDETIGGRAEQADDADAALRDGPVRGAEHVAAVGEGQQNLLDLLVAGRGRGQLIALKAHGVPIGCSGQGLSAGSMDGGNVRSAGTWQRGASRDPGCRCPSSSPTRRC